MKKLLALLLAASLVFCSSCLPKEQAKEPLSEEPRLLLTIACLSDLHNQEELITANPPTLRQDIADVLTAMKNEEERVDVILIGGDVTSDSTTGVAEVHGILDQLKSYTDLLTPNVLYVSGNHDYNAGYSAGYNSADYYDYLMKNAVGTLTGNDAYYEHLLNEDYLLGYHYVINGFDFIGISPSPADLKKDQNYYYQFTSGTVAWLESTLSSIGAAKTVFLFGHFPFDGSYSLNSGKGMREECNAQLLSVCSKYPNLLYFYGHDHAGDTAYIRTDTAQRVTRYDSAGQVAGGGTEVTSLDARSQWTAEETENGVALRSVSGGKYLAQGETGLFLSDTPYAWVFTAEKKGLALRGAASGKGLFLSDATGTFTVNDSASALQLYTVSDTGFAKAESVTVNESYVIVSKGHKGTRALTNQAAVGSKGRFTGLTVTVSGDTVFTESVAVQTGEAGFTTSFMGSMRYYNNSFNGLIGTGYPDIVQALMIYVYTDRIELQMKNYGKEDGGTRVTEPYVLTRQTVADKP